MIIEFLKEQKFWMKNKMVTKVVPTFWSSLSPNVYLQYISLFYRFFYLNHNYNKILDSDWLLARPIFYQIGAHAAKVSNNKVSNNKVSNNKVRVLRMRALFTWFLVVTKYSLIFLKPSASRMAFLP
jgi:hypothetical protein